MRTTAIAWCENGHACTIEVHHAVIERGRVVGGFCGSSADFCDACDGLVVQVWPAPLSPALALATHVPGEARGYVVPTTAPDGSLQVIHPNG